MEDGITSAERDDSVASSLHSRSGSICGDNNNDRYAPGSPPASSSAATTALPSTAAATTNDHHDRDYPNNNGGDYRANGFSAASSRAGNDVAKAAAALAARSGSTGVFCQTWDWGRAATPPTFLSRATTGRAGSSIDRRFDGRMTVDTSVREDGKYGDGGIKDERSERSRGDNEEEYGDDGRVTGAQEEWQYQVN